MTKPDSRFAPAAARALGHTRASVAAGFVRGILAGVVARRGDVQELLARAGIAGEVLADDGMRIPVERYAALYNQINAELDDEGFGLFSVPLRVGSFELLCRAVSSAPTLAVALERCARFLRVLLPDIAVSVDCEGEQCRLVLREVAPLPVGRVFAFEWLLRLLHGLACWLVGRAVALDSVSFPYPAPAHAADYALIYTEDSRFLAPDDDGDDTLVASFAANLLELPVRRDEAALAEFLVGAPGRLTTLYRRDREMVARVRDCLRTTLPQSPTLAGVARALHLSPRTLHRRLEDEGSSFQAIKDALRRDLAISRLAKTRQPLTVIAADLGFADASAFYRAFVGWTGEAPTHYRRRARGAPASG
ncbi:AraC family transcriptional regulator [Rhodocyclus purpureus]|uniref:AraC family transcriptional regulator n=1 Tax=Rhodocyclus purpureus TaxID=1067 RepID=UPI003084199F